MEGTYEGIVKDWGGGTQGNKCYIDIEMQKTSNGRYETVRIWSTLGLPPDIKVGMKYRLIGRSRDNVLNEIKRL